jgi:CspA family cold shock protein
MVVGTVKWFNIDRGYGFIAPEQGKDVFVHISALAASDLQVLTEGQRVEFEVEQDAKGLRAVHVGPPKSVSPPVGLPPGATDPVRPLAPWAARSRTAPHLPGGPSGSAGPTMESAIGVSWVRGGPPGRSGCG